MTLDDNTRSLLSNLWLTNDEYLDLLNHVAERCYGTADRPSHPEDLSLNFEIANLAIASVINWYREHWRRVGFRTRDEILGKISGDQTN